MEAGEGLARRHGSGKETSSLHQQILHSWSHSYAAQKRLIKKSLARGGDGGGGGGHGSEWVVHGRDPRRPAWIPSRVQLTGDPSCPIMSAIASKG